MLLPRDETTDRPESIDDRETSIRRVSLPSNSRGFGLEKGTVYLQRPIPVTTPSAGSPARTS